MLCFPHCGNSSLGQLLYESLTGPHLAALCFVGDEAAAMGKVKSAPAAANGVVFNNGRTNSVCTHMYEYVHKRHKHTYTNTYRTIFTHAYAPMHMPVSM